MNVKRAGRVVQIERIEQAVPEVQALRAIRAELHRPRELRRSGLLPFLSGLVGILSVSREACCVESVFKNRWVQLLAFVTMTF